MPHIFHGLARFQADRAWGALDLGDVEGASVRVHWTDQPYRWHVNDGREVFVVLDGSVMMRWRDGGDECEVELVSGSAFVADVGDEHIASPRGAARILVIERRGST